MSKNRLSSPLSAVESNLLTMDTLIKLA